MRAEDTDLAVRTGSLRASRRPSGPFRRPGLALAVALAATAACLVVLAAYPALARGLPREVTLWLGYLLSWLPLAAGIVGAALLGGGRGSVANAIGLRVRPVDIALGLAVGLGLRSLVELIAPTSADLTDTALENQAQWLCYAIGIGILVVAACLIGPVVEESLFRGVIQPALTQLLPATGPGRASELLRSVTAIVITSIIFAAMHVLATTWPPGTGTLLATLGIGVGCGILASTTERLGGAILAHAIFNASGLAITYLS